MQNQFLPPEVAVETTAHVAPSDMLEPLVITEPAHNVEAVTDMLAKTQRAIRRRKFRFWAAFAVTEAVFLLPAALGFVSLASHNDLREINFFLFALLFGVAAFSVMLITLFMPVKLDMEALMKLGGTRAIPTLLDALTLKPSTGYRKSVLNVLTVLLPQMQASDASLLTPSHCRLFTVWLTHAFNSAFFRGVGSDFIVALLKAYEQVGDAKAIPIVERLANSAPRSEGQRRIQQAAQDCLPLLQAHVSGVDVTQTLLRASMPETNTPATLLRAATADVSTN